MSTTDIRQKEQIAELAGNLKTIFERQFLQIPTNPEMYWRNTAELLLSYMTPAIKTQALEDAAQAYPDYLRDLVTRHSVRVWLINRADAVKKGWTK